MIARLYITVYLLGALVFLTSATFTHKDWGHVYYLWQKTCDLLACTAVVYSKSNARFAIPVLYLMGARLIWEVISYSSGIYLNDFRAVGILFVILTIVCLYITIKELVTWHKQK